MRTLAFLLLLCSAATAAPSIEPLKTELEVRETTSDDAQNQRGLLYDNIEHDAKTDGFSSDIHEDCRNTIVRYRRSDGKVVTRTVDRCH